MPTALPISEYQEALWLVNYLDILVIQKKVLIYSHIPSETYTKSWSVKLKNKRMGVSSGVPDYLIVFPHKIIFIELKREKGGVLSQSQKVWIDALNKASTEAYVCKGFTEAKEVIDQCLMKQS